MSEEKTGIIDECDTEKFGTQRVSSSNKTIAIPGDRWRRQTAKLEGDKRSKTIICHNTSGLRRGRLTPTCGSAHTRIGRGRKCDSTAKGCMQKLPMGELG